MKAPFIMLVDDEVPFAETLAKRLDKRGMETLIAFSGEEGMETLNKNQNLDVIILDVKMPGLDGIETLRKIKKDFPMVEVIMLTGHATVESGINGMKLGAFDYLMKPCNIEELVMKVTEAVQKKRAHEDKIKDAESKAILSKYEP